MNKKIFFLLFVTLLIVPTVSAQTVNEGLPRFRIAVQGGYGCRFGKHHERGSGLADRAAKRIRNGFIYGADFTWFTDSNYGFGLKFSDVHSKSEDWIMATKDFITVAVSGESKTVLDLRFIGPTYSFRHVSQNNKCFFLINGGFGYLSYDRSNLYLNSLSFEKGGTLGFCADAGVDFRLMKSLYLGVSFGAIIGTLSSSTYRYDENKRKGDHHEMLSHFKFTMGLRLYL